MSRNCLEEEVFMDEIIKRKLKMNPRLIREVETKGRCWLTLSRVETGNVRTALEKYFNKQFDCIEIKPEFEFVFYIPGTEGNTYEELLAVAYKRARYSSSRPREPEGSPDKPY